VGIAGSLLGGKEKGMSGSGDLPFTGSIFTLPLIVLGLVLTFAGWVAAHARGEHAS
jgi:hypothetical protein